MKSYHEVADEVFRRRDAYVQHLQSKAIFRKRITAAALTIVLVATVLLSAGAAYVYAVREDIIEDYLGILQSTVITYEVTDDGRIKERKKPDWGITLSAANVAPTGMPLIYTQSGGNIGGKLMTGTQFYIEVKTDSGCVPLKAKAGSNIWQFQEIAVHLDDTVSWIVEWDNIYGKLNPGTYRLCKPFWLGPYLQNESYNYKVEFIIE